MINAEGDSILWAVHQWYDYRKENFFRFLGIFDSFEGARSTALNGAIEFRQESWMKNSSYVKITGSKESRVVVDLFSDEGERCVFDITPLQRRTRGDHHTVTVHLFWGGWAGRNTCEIVDPPPDQKMSGDMGAPCAFETKLHEFWPKNKDVFFNVTANLNVAGETLIF